jgi:hypothetical protein
MFYIPHGSRESLEAENTKGESKKSPEKILIMSTSIGNNSYKKKSYQYLKYYTYTCKFRREI